MAIQIRQAAAGDASLVQEMLVEAARWIDALGVTMWREGEFEADAIAGEVTDGQFFIAEVDGAPAGTVRFQRVDLLFWPDIPQDESAFIHRLVVRRAYKGQGGVSTALLDWSVERARAFGLRYLRLDCDAQRPKVRAVYEAFGFRLHSYRQVGPYYVARYEYPL